MPLKLERRGKYWHYSGTVAGRRLRKSTKTTDKKTAERVKADAEALAWKRNFDGPGAGLTMAQALIAYIDAGKPDRFIGKLNDYWGDTLVDDVTPEAIRQSARKIYPDAQPATWNRQVIVPTQAAINHAAALFKRPEIKVKRFPVDPRKKEAATLDWVNAFASQATEDGLIHLSAMCLFMFGTAARVGEACRVTWADIDLQASTATIYMRKPTPWSRTAHLPPRILAALANIPSNRKPEDLVFEYAGRGSVTKVWNNVVERAEIEPLTPHCCRHGFATRMLQAGFDVKTVAERGGWKDPNVVLKTYAHAIKDITITDAVFGTQLTQDTRLDLVSIRNKRKLSL